MAATDTIFYEPTMGKDDFKQTKVKENWEAIATSICMVLFGKPGFYPTIPDLGLNIRQYRNMRLDEIDPDEIKLALSSQLPLLSDDIMDGLIEVETVNLPNGDAMLLITIPIGVSTEEDDDSDRLLIGLQQNGIGEMSFNYQLVDVKELL